MASAPERSCAVCRKKMPQAQLQRWTVIDGLATPNIQDGRGYYSCSGCADKAKQLIEARSQVKHNKRRA